MPFNMQTKFHRNRGVLEITQDANAFMLPFHGISTCQSTYTSISYLHLNVHSKESFSTAKIFYMR